jgi:phosphoribosylaminoimidazolecarboxamide formyltransferase/IMP cyclohydrolase
MMTVNVVRDIDNAVKIGSVLLSVSDKHGLEDLVPGLLEVNPDVHLYSTGGTFGRVSDILGPRKAERCLTPVSEYTGQPETQGGLVKTLDFKIYLGLLTETYNEAHQADLERTGAVPIDMVVCNLYPFAKTISAGDVTVEGARSNVDIGGPCMVRASAKNYLRVASVVDPGDYPAILDALKSSGGCLDLETRFRLACKAFRHTAEYDATIAGYLEGVDLEDERRCYEERGEKGTDE